MPKPRSIINFYFDVVSPYSYIGFESILRYEKCLPAQLNFIPFFLGATIVKSGNRANAAVPSKGEYMRHDLEAANRYWGFSMKWPSNFEERIIKQGSIKPQRFLTALKQEKPELLRPTAREFASRVWFYDQPIYQEENIKEVCSKLSIPDSEKLIELSKSDAVKKEYQRATDEAMESGAFGAPWIVLKQEGKEDLKFWGSDRLHYICNELGVEFKGPFNGEVEMSPKLLTSSKQKAMTHSRPIINFYFDVISQYSFIGFESILQYEKHLPAQLNFNPFFLGATIAETKNRPNIACPAKLPYMQQDIQIASRYWGLSMKWPKNFEERIFKLGSIKPQRFLTALKLENPTYLVPATREFASRAWTFDLPIHQEENIREVCSKLSIPDSEKIIKLSKSDSIKKEYQRATDEAMESGAFGAPWIVLKQDGKKDLKFWGSDRLHYICNELGVEFKGPLKGCK